MKHARGHHWCWLLWALSFSVQAAHLPGYAVSSASPEATKAGMAILAEGGNAFDAAVTVAATLAVTQPYASGIGGGGFWLLHDEKKHDDVFIDAREVAPRSAHGKLFLNAKGERDPRLSLFSPLAAGIPGEPAALDYVAIHYGRLPLSETLKPAIAYAQSGFIVNEGYRRTILSRYVLANLLKHSESRRIFLNDHTTVAVGERIIQPDLAAVLQTLAQKGRAGFYQGAVAEILVREVRRAGGIWDMDDLKNYQVKVRKPLVAHYGNTTITTAPPPSAGGVAIVTMFHILQAAGYDHMPHLQQLHYVIEAMRLAYWDRATYLGDPDLVALPLAKLLSPEHAAALVGLIRPQIATPSERLPDVNQLLHEASPNTSHFSVIDAEGNRVAVTLSINLNFGSGIVVPGTGILLNNQMDDFASHVGSSNVFDLVGGANNLIAPGKRPLSSMSPTFLERPDAVAVLGSIGGSKIPTAVFLASLAFAQGKTPMTFVTQPRFHHQYLPDQVDFERDAFSLHEQAALKKQGYLLQPIAKAYGSDRLYFGDINAIAWLKSEDALVGVADPRNNGLAEVHRLIIH